MTGRVPIAARAVLGVLLGVLGSFALAAPTPAYADDGAQISHFEQTQGGVQMLVSVPASAQVDLTKVGVSIAGHRTTATAQEGSSGAVRRTAILAIDTSNSMRGPKFDAAKAAAAAFIAELPADVYLGIVTFNGSVTTSLQPTQDRAQATKAINGLALSHGTLLYDGVQAALDASGTTGQRSLLVLSDGADTASTESLGQLTAAITQAGALVDVVAVDQSGTAAPLQALAKAGRGAVLPSDPTALAQTLTQEAGVLAHQVLVTAQLPSGLTATQGSVDVTLPLTDGGAVRASAYDDNLQAAAPTAAVVPTVGGNHWVLPSWVMYAGVLALAIGLFAMLFILMPRPRAASAEEIVTTYTARTRRSAKRSLPKVDAEHAFATATTAAADLLKRNAGLEARIARALDGAGSDLKPAEWLLLHLVIAVGAGLVGLLLGAGDTVVGLLFLAMGAAGPWLYLSVKRGARRRRFYEGLPDTLQLMSGSLSAGLSLMQTVDTVVHEGSDPIASEFRRAMVETRLGVEIEDALDGIAARFDSADFSWVVMAIRIQRQVGGNLAELFDTVAATLRERQYVRRQVSALSAEGKLSAVVIGSLPPIFTLYLLLTNRTYLHPLFHDPRGIAMVVFGVVWLSIGVFWMSRLVKVEV